MTYHYCSCIRVLSSLHVYGFTATCFHVWLTLRMLSFVVDLVLVGSSNVSCAIVIYLSYCYGDQLSFAAFACLLRDSRHHIHQPIGQLTVQADVKWAMFGQMVEFCHKM